ncbi:collagen alpha-4(VI) chain [Biomphalaria glabrata]|nr:collagen alpha-4(VI) chain-like [Biomphalaria glabrata]
MCCPDSPKKGLFLYWVICFFLGAKVGGAPVTSDLTCHRSADIVFLVDTSTSIWSVHFNTHMKTFLKEVISTFHIGPGPLDTRVGVILFGTYHYVEFDLSKYKNVADTLKAVERMTYRRGNTQTNTHAALEYVAENMFNSSHGFRPNSFKTVIAITDGVSRYGRKTTDAAKFLKNQGVTIFAIGVGNNTNNIELREMASSPSYLFFFQVKDFKSLTNVEKRLTRLECTDFPTIKPENLQHDQAKPSTCDGKAADIYFLLDASTSVGSVRFRDKVLPFVRDLVSSFPISPQHTRIGLVTFSDNAHPNFNLSSFADEKSLLASLQPEHIEYLTGSTNTGDAIKFVSNIGFGPSQARKDAVQIIITLTDGLSQLPEYTASEAAEAKKRGIIMFAVGVGMQVDVKELTDISSDPDDDYVFHIETFSNLSMITTQIANKLCQTKAPQTLQQCLNVSSNIIFAYEYPNTISSSKLILDDLVLRFSEEASRISPNIKIGTLTQPCVRDAVSLVEITRFQEALNDMKNGNQVGFSSLLTKLRVSEFHQVPRDSRKIAVLVVSRKKKNWEEIAAEVKLLKSTGVKIYLVAVGEINQTLLEELATAPVNKHVIKVSSYTHLKDAKLDVLEIVCGINSGEKNEEANTRKSTMSTAKMTSSFQTTKFMTPTTRLTTTEEKYTPDTTTSLRTSEFLESRTSEKNLEETTPTLVEDASTTLLEDTASTTSIETLTTVEDNAVETTRDVTTFETSDETSLETSTFVEEITNATLADDTSFATSDTTSLETSRFLEDTTSATTTKDTTFSTSETTTSETSTFLEDTTMTRTAEVVTSDTTSLQTTESVDDTKSATEAELTTSATPDTTSEPTTLSSTVQSSSMATSAETTTASTGDELYVEPN